MLDIYPEEGLLSIFILTFFPRLFSLSLSLLQWFLYVKQKPPQESGSFFFLLPTEIISPRFVPRRTWNIQKDAARVRAEETQTFIVCRDARFHPTPQWLLKRSRLYLLLTVSESKGVYYSGVWGTRLVLRSNWMPRSRCLVSPTAGRIDFATAAAAYPDATAFIKRSKRASASEAKRKNKPAIFHPSLIKRERCFLIPSFD